MANVKDCPGFETFGEDVRAGRKAQGMTRRALAEEVGVSTRYLANIELGLIIPSVPVILQLIRICHLPVERYFNPNLVQENSEVRRRVRHKSLFKISPRMSWRRIFRPDCVKNPCHPSGCLRIFALQGKKSSRQSIHVEILNRL